ANYIGARSVTAAIKPDIKLQPTRHVKTMDALQMGCVHINVMQHGHIAQRGNHDELAQQSGWYRDMYRYQQLEAALDDAPEIREEAVDA
ncbi:hypothetical protein, partial [Shigella boydii]|uniref:hypothetical protein n=1 Tax=Shigella boydii TaxID=621 RepID=UPI002093E092